MLPVANHRLLNFKFYTRSFLLNTSITLRLRVTGSLAGGLRHRAAVGVPSGGGLQAGRAAPSPSHDLV